MKRLISARDIEELRKSRGTLIISKNVVLTPTAKDLIKEYGIQVVEESEGGRRHLDSRGNDTLITPLDIYLIADTQSENYVSKMRLFWKKLQFPVTDLGRANDEKTVKNILAKIPETAEAVIYMAENGFRETAWVNKHSPFSAVRCADLLEVQEALGEIDAGVLVLSSELMGWKQALRTAYEFVKLRQKYRSI